MDGPRFAVVMPLYNKAAHVRDAIDSVLAQTYPAHEIIVIDNRSTDGGRAIVEAIDDPRIRLLDLPTPGPGGYAGRNMGIDAATSEWIAFLDADDLWTPDHLALLARGTADELGIDAVATGFDHVFDDRREPQRIAPALEHPVTLDFAQFLDSWLAVRECPMWTGAIAIRRAAILAAGGFPDGKAVRGGDKELWLRVVRNGLLRYYPALTAAFHRDSENKVSKSTTTLGLPYLVGTARAMVAGASPREAALLRRLVNQEIAHYARYAMKHTGRTTIRARDVYLPEGVGTAMLVLAARLIPAGLRRRGHLLRDRWAKRA
ncbi:glycosyltransferase family 2 protein [Sphingomonas sp. SUN019]|uniref:glycosyltransferase family 2 protein n=1 Tax=Sphingomonas sp. SUN019 TaxID=2937788 RepID=UPI0021644565|nr:glycosyltransferase family A protein [Sphingomonas sp. SUN019]UVO49034.1 glycosyltransferase family 2 protein [Sphingomonas sp. SUN019]